VLDYKQASPGAKLKLLITSVYTTTGYEVIKKLTDVVDVTHV